ncbi:MULTISPECIES: PhoX family protein [Marinobacter]|jgi:hypothetical protein|uniref:PhoX family protein n=1 Tax=Marinobacter TaxID=2742 RepID=UPI002573DD55|nr:PhoX family phosphatase [Marinobacter shengliensis]WBU40236.1 PhoX family phosphatase [Marinobacter alkaliphilus]BEH15449.1 hypothetical protein MAALD49_28170 [Marinobacter shengliensis]
MFRKKQTLVVDNSGIDPVTNFSNNESFQSVLSSRMERRTVLKGAMGASLVGFFGLSVAGCNSSSSDNSDTTTPDGVGTPQVSFKAIPISREDSIVVPEGYNAQALAPWGTPLTGSYPDYRADGTNSGSDQEQQVGSHHDGMHFYPIDVKEGGSSSEEGLLVMNHEYVDVPVLHANGPSLNDGQRPADEVRKEIAAHGISVAHIRKDENGVWDIVHGSPYNRRVTAGTPMDIAGPVRGTDLVVSRYSTDGTRTRGTINNCAHGVTPWNTYLTCEENWAGYFVNKGERNKEQLRYGVSTNNGRYSWELADDGADEYIRFDVTASDGSAKDDYRNEANTFGWIVEIDPFNPESVPQKRTALGRFAHEGIVFQEPIEGEPLVAYSGDDARFEYIYKFVSKQPYYASSAGGYLLNEGTLYAAKFNDDGSGEWLPLSIDDDAFFARMTAAVGTTVGNITFEEAFATQAELLMNSRLAADIAGATKMDRPEWGAVHPKNRDVYFALTNNTSRAEEDTNNSNPRANSISGHIIRWTEANGNPVSETFSWDIFVMAGNAEGMTSDGFEKEVGQNLITGEALTEDSTFAAPDGLWFDPNGTLWIQTDMSGSLLRGEGNAGDFGNNMMLAANPETGEIKRFLVGPTQCEVTGVVTTPDGKTMFVNIQHPGDTSTPGNFTSNWPDGGTNRPRSATVVITKEDGGLIGS